MSEPKLGIYSGDQQEPLFRIVSERDEHDERHKHESHRWQFDCLWCVHDQELTAREQAARIETAWRFIFTSPRLIDKALADRLLDILVGQWSNGQQVPGSGRAYIETRLD